MSDNLTQVKYGNTLKRINGSVKGRSLDLNMITLKLKIKNAFKLGQACDLVLSYTDEDGDIVILDDDDDLHDASINQRLNPLRITVQLRCNAANGPNTNPHTVKPKESGQISSALDVALKSLSALDGALNSLSKMPHDLLKAASILPGFAELVDHLKKIATLNTVNDLPGSSSTFSVPPIPLVRGKPVSEVIPYNQPLSSVGDLQNHAEPKSMKLKFSTDLDTEVSLNQCESGDHSVNDLLVSTLSSGHSMESSGKFVLPATSVSSSPDLFMDQNVQNGIAHSSRKSIHPANPVAAPPDMFIDQNEENYDASTARDKCHTNGVTHKMGNEKSRQPGFSVAPPISTCIGTPFGYSYKRFDGYLQNPPPAFHTGIICDGCGMHPIMGPRYKSKVKDDYDLCSICFAQKGIDADYTRIDAASFSNSVPNNLDSHLKYHSQSHDRGMRPMQEKFGSSFMDDVTVKDGSWMAPSVPFTKIWRMHNNGVNKWPYGTQLVWVGGAELTTRRSVQLDIPLNGFPVGEKIDIAVDFLAPPTPGRYVSYWILALPSGIKFGQRVRVHIQVDPKNSSGAVKPVFNLNLPPEMSGQSKRGTIDVNAEPSDDVRPEPNATSILEGLVNPLIDMTLTQGPELAINDLPPPSNASLVAAVPTPEAVSAVPHPIMDRPPPVLNASAVATTPISPRPVNKDNSAEVLLKQLDEMGFNQIGLNMAVLRRNNYDLEQTIDDLCRFL